MTLCLECDNGFYLVERNICIQRTSISQIDNCLKLEINVEKCAQCVDQFELTTDKLACLPVIPKCLTYKPSTQVQNDHVCDSCINEYYFDLELSRCEQGTIEYCEVYQKKRK